MQRQGFSDLSLGIARHLRADRLDKDIGFQHRQDARACRLKPRDRAGRQVAQVGGALCAVGGPQGGKGVLQEDPAFRLVSIAQSQAIRVMLDLCNFWLRAQPGGQRLGQRRFGGEAGRSDLREGGQGGRMGREKGF